MANPINKDFEKLKSKLARTLKEMLQQDCETPDGEKFVKCDIHIPYHTIVPSDEERNTATAAVTYIVQYVKEKTHTVRIKFGYDEAGRFIRNSMVYV
jgi:hypothetical protein